MLAGYTSEEIFEELSARFKDGQLVFVGMMPRLLDEDGQPDHRGPCDTIYGVLGEVYQNLGLLEWIQHKMMHDLLAKETTQN